MPKTKKLEALAIKLMVPPRYLEALLDAKQRNPRLELKVKAYSTQLTKLAFSKRDYAKFREFLQAYANVLGEATSQIQELNDSQIDWVLDYICYDKGPRKF